MRGNPTPVISWYKDEIEIDPNVDSKYNIVNTGKHCQLKITDLNESENGRYMCEATNRIGRVSTFARLSVIDDPKVLAADKNFKM